MNRIVLLLLCILTLGAVYLLKQYRQSKKTIIRRVSTKKTLPDTKEEQTLQSKIIPDKEESKTNTEHESKEEYPRFIHSNKQNLTIEPCWDKIVFEFQDSSFSYEPPPKIGDYIFRGTPEKFIPPEDKFYLPYRTTWRYENQFGNKMEVINTFRRYGGVDTVSRANFIPHPGASFIPHFFCVKF